MIIWKGYGILGVIVPAVIFFGGQWLLDSVLGNKYYDKPVWGAACFLLCALAVWFIGRKLNSQPERTLVDTETGEEIKVKSQHTLFFIPMQYTALLWLILAVTGLVAKFAN